MTLTDINEQLNATDMIMPFTAWYNDTFAYNFQAHIKEVIQISQSKAFFLIDIADVEEEDAIPLTFKARILPNKRNNVKLTYSFLNHKLKFVPNKSGITINSSGDTDWGNLIASLYLLTNI